MFLTAEKALFGAEDTCCCMERRRTSGQFNSGTTLNTVPGLIPYYAAPTLEQVPTSSKYILFPPYTKDTRYLIDRDIMFIFGPKGVWYKKFQL